MRQEILSGVERRRRWSDAEKLRIVTEAAADGALVADVARRYGITRQHIYQWRRELRDKAQPLIKQSNFVAVELTGSDERHDMITPAVAPVATGAHHLEIMLRNGRSLVSIRCSPRGYSAGCGVQAAAAPIAGFWLDFQFHGKSSAICLAG